MKTFLLAFAVITPITLLALPNYDPFADATGSSGTAYVVGNWVSKNDGGTAGTGQKDATGGQWYTAPVPHADHAMEARPALTPER